MRLRWGPHASSLAQQVVLRDPFYVVQTLSEHPESVLAAVFRDLILAFDERAVLQACARCARQADGLCAYPESVELIGFCRRCVDAALALPQPAFRLQGYEDAVRHVAVSFRRGHRANMRRIVTGMAHAKGGPPKLTEDAAMTFFAARQPTRTTQLARRS